MRKSLINARHDANMTQKEIAKKIDVSERFYQSLEAGVATGKIERWFQLAKILDKPMSEILNNER